MTSNFNSDSARKLLEAENMNVTEKNPLAELGKVCFYLFVVLFILYLSIFVATGSIIASLSPDAQVKLEGTLSSLCTTDRFDIIEENPERVVNLKNRIIQQDGEYPQIANQDIYIIDMNMMNAFCAPNGSIYITEKLYNKLDTDEKLAFILAHEMAHYKNRDHLTALRKSVSKMFVLLALSLNGDAGSLPQKMVTDSITLGDFHHSRVEEIKADTYAGKVLVNLFGSTKGGVEVFHLLSEDDKLSFALTSTHPLKEDRIELLESLK